jgi:general secretion pathway protein M
MDPSQRLRSAAAALEPLRARWQALGARERKLLTLAAWAIGIGLLWWVAIAPAWRTTSTAPQRLDQLDAQLLQMQRMAGEVRGLRAAPAVGVMQAQAAVKAATEALGPSARLQLAGERATVNFTNASGAQVRDWLAEVRAAARARPIEATLTRGPQGLSGSVVVALPGGGPP